MCFAIEHYHCNMKMRGFFYELFFLYSQNRGDNDSINKDMNKWMKI